LRPEAFRIRLLDAGVIVPRTVRIVRSALDDPELPGTTVEIDLGALPQHEDGSLRSLSDGDFLSVELLSDSGLMDYAGRSPLPSATQFWSVVAGRSLHRSARQSRGRQWQSRRLPSDPRHHLATRADV
jgi:hypothetical protein